MLRHAQSVPEKRILLDHAWDFTTSTHFLQTLGQHFHGLSHRAPSLRGQHHSYHGCGQVLKGDKADRPTQTALHQGNRRNHD